jgi:hypothetical protein
MHGGEKYREYTVLDARRWAKRQIKEVLKLESKPDDEKSSLAQENSKDSESTSAKTDATPAEPDSSAKSEAEAAKPETAVEGSAAALEPTAGAENSESPNGPTPAEDETQQSHMVATPHHTPKILAEVLDEPVPQADGKDSFRHPMYMDALVAIGLLVAMAGFTVGVIKIYITHTAKSYITERHYKEAIVLLAGAPLPGWFAVEGESPEELLNQALYLDSMEKLDLDYNDQVAIKELEKIKPGPRFFELSNEVLAEHAPQSSTTLQGTAEHQATPAEIRSNENKPILPESQESN